MLTIRKYQLPDQDLVWDLHTRAMDAVGANLGPGPWNDDLKSIQTVYLDGGGEFLVGFVEDRLVAMGALRRETSTRAEIKRMRVHPDFQRQGFGQQILSLLEQRARELGYNQLVLDTSTLQGAAQNLYLKNGYREVRRDRFDRLDCIYYEKTLLPE